MKTKIIFGLLLSCGLVVAAFVLVIGLRSTPVTAERQLPDEAQSWITSIQSGAVEWKQQLQIEETAHAHRVELEDTVSGLRKSLCSRYHVVVNANGDVVDVETCPVFTLGTPPAQ